MKGRAVPRIVVFLPSFSRAEPPSKPPSDQQNSKLMLDGIYGLLV